MIKLSNGVEISENTVVSALKKAGISVEPKPKKHIFSAGDMAKNDMGLWRLIVRISGKNYSVDRYGTYQGQGQGHFEALDYKYVGKLSNTVS